jgi:hypothetical protein
VWDLLIFSMTLFRSYKDRSRQGVPGKTDLFSLMVRDGKFQVLYRAKMKSHNDPGAIYFGYAYIPGGYTEGEANVCIALWFFLSSRIY